MADETAVDRSFAEHLREVWGRLERLCGQLTDAEWDRPTDCPSWTVRDQLAHIVGTEVQLAGEAPPPALDRRPDHVRNDLGAFNEAWIESLRGLAVPELVSRFSAVTERRLDQLGAMTDDELLVETDSPVGRTHYHRFMGVRVMDCWVHEQDIRLAVERPGGLRGGAAEASVERLLHSLGYVVGKRVAPPDDTVVVVRLDGPVHRERAVRVSGGRATPVEVPERPTSVVVTDSGTFARLAAGRWSAGHAVEAGLVEFGADAELGRSVVDNLATTP